jgi:hypothetical protein
MLTPVTVPLNTLVAGPNSVRISLEDSLNVSQLLFPKLRVYNRCSHANVSVLIDELENMGVSANPLQNGTLTVNKLTTILSPSKLLWHTFSVPFLRNPVGLPRSTTYPYFSHVLTLTNLSAIVNSLDMVNVSLVGFTDIVNPGPGTNTISVLPYENQQEHSPEVCLLHQKSYQGAQP